MDDREQQHPASGLEILATGSTNGSPQSSPLPISNTLNEVSGMERISTSRSRRTSSSFSASNADHLGTLSQPTPTPNKLSPIDEPPPPPQFSATRLFFVATIVTFTMAMSAAGQQTLNIALPTIQVELGMRETDLQWLGAAYSLTNGCFLLLSGRLADVYGRKPVFLAGLVFYAVFSLVGGFMKNGVGLIVTRALAGCGAAMSTPSAVGIIAYNFSGRARSTAFASFSAGAPVGGALGLLLGGLFTAYVDDTWRGALFTLAGLAFAVTVAAIFVIPKDLSLTNDKRVDWIGAALVTVGLVLLQFVISDGESAPNGWKTSYIIALIIVGVVFIVTFFFWERHVINNTSQPPLMRLQLFTRAKGRLSAVYFIGFVTWMAFVSLFYHATLYFQQVQNASPVTAMLQFLPTSISGIICNVIVAFLISRVRTQWLVCVGLLATGLANVCLALSDENTRYWGKPFCAMWLAVMGADFLMATGLIFVSALSLPDEQSVAGALFQTLLQLGGSFGLAITSVISDVEQTKALQRGETPTHSLLVGLQASFWLGAAMSFLALIIAMIALRGMGTIGRGVKRSKKKEVVVNEEEEGEGDVEQGEREKRQDVVQ
ncbi:hypothetical protein CI109_100270 [Kwoniella shandongensis]|uniref:Uncharacterized protein n=1 Tax=Kwoniella shandongensis TaxID=1734106 RepID=A0A5M6C962_9TREE|nr:uncharacterized protein CI109_001885 [Kwoniella shandongensis]KAA5529945.1 hypothetical protein CI109_001885 [Kwoniella shandongensis]